MADSLLITGDDFEHPMFREDDEVAVPIPLTSTVQAALVDEDGTVLISATAVSSATAGSDWPSGKLVVKFSAAQTGAINTALLPKLVRIHVKITSATGQAVTYKSEYFLAEEGAI